MGITPRDPAHFDPVMGDYKDLRPFRMWCQKVLPLVYDESLSYYEVLCKLVDYLNKTMEDVGVLHDDVDALYEAYQQLQAYVNDYFSTLDVQEEINNKLDVMAEDGTLDALLLPYFNAYKDEINSIVSEQNQNISNQFNVLNTGLQNQSNLINQNANNINTLSARMDTFTNLPDGSTSGDAELADIRTDINGNTYNNAGTAVRSQVEFIDDNTSLLANNKINFGMFGDFVNGAIGVIDGELYDEGRQYKYRIATPNIITLPYNSTFTAKSGFIFNYFKFVNGNYISVEQNLTTKNIPKDEQFKITIFRTTENESEIANVFDFLSRVIGVYSSSEMLDIRTDINGNTYNNAGTAVRSQVEGVDNNTALLANNKINFGMFGSFVNGAIGVADGVLIDEGRQYKYRIASPNIMTLPYDSTFTANSGFRFNYFKFVNGGYVSAEQNLTTKNIPKDEQFKITIFRITESESEIANVFEFLSRVIGNYAGTPELLDIRNSADGVTYDSAGDAVRKQVTTLSNGETVLSKNNVWLRFFGNFVNGTLNGNNGEILSGYNYRVCSSSIITMPYNCTLKAKTGFNFMVFKYVNNVYQSFVTDLTAYNALMDEQLKIVIKRNNENVSEVADINEFCLSVIADNPITSEIQPANFFLNVSNWTQGSISSTGEDTETNLRIRTGFVPFMNTLHYTFSCVNGYQYSLSYYDVNKNYIGETGWLRTEYEVEYTSNLGYIRMLLAPVITREILPSECINLISVIKSEINNSIIALKNEIDNIDSLSVKNNIKNNNIASNSAVESSVYKPYNYSYANKIYSQFLITTDVHSDWVRLNRAFEYGEENTNVDITFCLGDVCDVPNQLSTYDWKNNVLSYQKPIIPIIGNHDVAVVGSIYKTDDELYNYFFDSDLQTHNGDMHTNNSLYWYKDIEKNYTDGNGNHTKKIRVIGMNMYELGDYTTNNRSFVYLKQAQIDWLIGLLDSVTSDMSVVILCHTAPTSLITTQSSLWSDLNPINLTIQFSGMSNKDLLCSIIDAWITGSNVTANCSSTFGDDTISVNHTFEAHTNQFIGWLGGHSHTDCYCVPTNYPNQKVILFNCTTATENQQDGDIGRALTGKSQDCVTLFTYDWDNNKIRLVRLGADYTVDGRHRVYCVV